MIADGRLPRGAKPFAWLAVGVFAIWYFTIPPCGRRRPSLGGLATEIGVTYATLAVSATALASVVIQRFRPATVLVTLYSRLTLYIVGGNLSLLVLGYWQAAIREQDLGTTPSLRSSYS